MVSRPAPTAMQVAERSQTWPRYRSIASIYNPLSCSAGRQAETRTNDIANENDKEIIPMLEACRLSLAAPYE